MLSLQKLWIIRRNVIWRESYNYSVTQNDWKNKMQINMLVFWSDPED